jgi:hypothetical protein
MGRIMNLDSKIHVPPQEFLVHRIQSSHNPLAKTSRLFAFITSANYLPSDVSLPLTVCHVVLIAK